ncbi:hypothetical protein E2C01_063371 [Portunus trituberculatus]|uniref:Uncharacterized protein n=1 Tax=Portunus trituberculatus TaxID=210409 RepID=A0A5B7HGW0_PORTR|nr:hypothetical protein [Portunus trituberculatus]
MREDFGCAQRARTTQQVCSVTSQCRYVGPRYSSEDNAEEATVESTSNITMPRKNSDSRVGYHKNGSPAGEPFNRVRSSKYRSSPGSIYRQIFWSSPELFVLRDVRQARFYCIRRLERVQKIATKMVLQLKDLTYEEWLKEIGLPTLYDGRE